MIENNKPTIFFSLGGIEEIGKNMYVFEHDDEIWIIDCGVKFVDKNVYLGFNMVICPFDYLEKNANKIKGIIITHGHEDHIGGLPYLLSTLSIPKIYGAKFTLALIKRKLVEHKNNLKPYSFEEIKDNSVIKSKYFTIDFFRVCHSIPDAFGVCLQTPNGIIVETGDFRFDFETTGDETDINKIAEIGLRNPDVLMCESTNAMTPGFGVSESVIINELKNVIERAKARIFLAVFASNINRVEQIINIAVKNKRKICLIGRSMINSVGASRECGFLQLTDDNFIDVKDINKYEPDEIFVLLTGSQGEETAALNQIASENHQYIKFNNTDTIIFSSNTIPGNYFSYERMLNKLYYTMAKIAISGGENKLHSSGHATQTELELMIKLVNPMYLIPIHGEIKMLSALVKEGKEVGLRTTNVIKVHNGKKLSLLNHKLEVLEDDIDTHDVFVDGKKINKSYEDVISYRRRLSEDGIITVCLLLDKQTKNVLSTPILTIKGTFVIKDNTNLISKITFSIKNTINEIPSKNSLSESQIKSVIEETVTKIIKENNNKNPIVKTYIFYN